VHCKPNKADALLIVGVPEQPPASAAGTKPEEVRSRRKELGVIPSMKRVDTCAAEFEAVTPYMYSSYDGDCECESTTNKKVLILGGGPNRIGQGIEFDYCCCHASFALRSAYITPTPAHGTTSHLLGISLAPWGALFFVIQASGHPFCKQQASGADQGV